MGKDFGSMLRQEWPKMIYKLSLKNVGVTRYHKVDHKEVCFQQESDSYHELMDYNKLFDPDVDVMQPPDNNQVTYMNTVQSLGDTITTVRIQKYENGIKGETTLGFRDRSQFVMQVQSLCKVTRTRDQDGKTLFRGNCPEFWKVGYCPHSARCAYTSDVDIHSKLIPKNLSSKPRRGAPSSLSLRLKETFDNFLILIDKVTIDFNRANENAYRFSGTESNLSQVIRDSPCLHQFAVNIHANRSTGYINKERLHWRYSQMKHIHCNVQNLLHETQLLMHNQTSVRRKIALDVANQLKEQIDQLLIGKPLQTNPHQRLKNSKLCELLNGGYSGESLVGTMVRKKFNLGWFQGSITFYFSEENYYHIDYLDGDGEDRTLEELREYANTYK